MVSAAWPSVKPLEITMSTTITAYGNLYTAPDFEPPAPSEIHRSIAGLDRTGPSPDNRVMGWTWSATFDAPERYGLAIGGLDPGAAFRKVDAIVAAFLALPETESVVVSSVSFEIDQLRRITRSSGGAS